MRRFVQTLVMLGIIGLISNSARAADRVACVSQSLLEIAIEQGIPIDEKGRPIVGCSLITDEFIESELAGTAQTKMVIFMLDCDVEPGPCFVRIIRAEYEGEPFFYEVGFYEAISLDEFEEAVVGVEDHGGPFLSYALPSGRALPEIPSAETMLAEAEAND